MRLLHPVGAGPASARTEPALLCESRTGLDCQSGPAGRRASWWLRVPEPPFPVHPRARSLRVPEPEGAVAGAGPWEAPAVELAPSRSCHPSVLLPRCLFLPLSRHWGRGRVARAPVGRADSDGGWSCVSQAKLSQAKWEAPLSGGGCEEGPQAGSLWGGGWRAGGSSPAWFWLPRAQCSGRRSPRDPNLRPSSCSPHRVFQGWHPALLS